MKTLKLIPLMLLGFLLGACGEKREVDDSDKMETTQQEFQDPEEAMTNWNNAWNTQDPQQIQALTASDAVLVLNGNEVPADSIPGFYQAAGSTMKDLQLRSLKKGITDHMAYDTGTYNHRYTNDTTHYQGSYTFIWERTEDESEWKVKAMNITDERNNQE